MAYRPGLPATPAAVATYTSGQSYSANQYVTDGAAYYQITTAHTATSGTVDPARSLELVHGVPLTAATSVTNASHLVFADGTYCTASQLLALAPSGGVSSTVGGAILNGLGDSITAQAIFQASNTPDARFPAWTISTAYVVGKCVQAGGLAFACTVAGSSASSGSGPTATALTDGTVTWQYLGVTASKNGAQGGFLSWAAIFSQGALHFDQTKGYSGFQGTLRKIVVANGGSGYVAPTITLNQGAAATATVVSGVITGVTITNPGNGTGSFTVNVADSGGTGAVLLPVKDGSGTFGSYGDTTSGMVARLSDCTAANSVNIWTVLGGTNDITAGVAYATIIANLRTCYETLVAAGAVVIAVPVLPRYGWTTAQELTLDRVNRWIRAYCRQAAWANPLGISKIALADATGLFTDGTNLTVLQPIGGSGNTAPAVTFDGTHPSTRGGMYLGYVVWQAAQKFVGPQQATVARNYSAFDGYDATLNPDGNLIEAMPWLASTAYAVGQLRSNSGNVYVVKSGGAGTSAASGGPTGTSSTITDGSVTWQYVRPSGLSVLGSGTGGTNTAATGITFSGSLAGGLTLVRTSGSASGTITESIESPWSDGHVGQRQVLAFSLGSGTTIEQWALRVMYGAPGLYGITAADLATNSWYAEAEVEVSGLANCCGVCIDGPFDNNIAMHSYAGSSGAGAGYRMAGASGDVISVPNSGRMWLTATPILLPNNLVNFCFAVNFSFDASGAAGSATLMAKINYLAMRRSAVVAVAATAYTTGLSATSGLTGSAVTMTFAQNGTGSTTITPTISGVSGTFSPTTVNLSGTTPGTCTFTPSTAGTAALSSTSSPTLTNNTGLQNYAVSSGPLLLDGLTSTVVGAYSVGRKLRTSYAGSAIQVRRSSDNTTQDIGFTGTPPVLDTASMLTFCGAGNGFISKVYDNSAGGHDLVQPTAANQPQIVASGAVLTLANTAAKPGVKFVSSSSQQFLTAASFPLGAVAAFSAHGVASLTSSSSAGARLLAYVAAGDSNDYAQPTSIIFASYDSSAGLQAYRNSQTAAKSIGAAPFQWALTSINSNPDLFVTVDGTAGTGGSNIQSNMGATGTLGLGGPGSGAEKMDGFFAEAIVVSGALASGDQVAIASSMKTYYGTP